MSFARRAMVCDEEQCNSILAIKQLSSFELRDCHSNYKGGGLNRGTRFVHLPALPFTKSQKSACVRPASARARARSLTVRTRPPLGEIRAKDWAQWLT